jgi:two-component system sensor histidine kinase KdpD
MQAKQIQGPWKTTERLMVAVSHSPYSERLIRATRRIAYNLEAPWLAVTIDTGANLSEQDQAQLAKNLELVHDLGGELVSTSETDIPSALKRVAQQKNVTQMVIGRPTRRLLRDLVRGGSLLDRLVRESGDFDVHVIRQDSGSHLQMPWWQRWTSHSRFEEYANVVWFLVVTALINFLLVPVAGYKAVGFVFLLAVLAVSLFASMGPILFAALASSLIWDYFFIPPQFTFAITDKEDMFMCAIYFISALTTGFLTNKIRLHQKILREKEERTNLLYEVVSDIAQSRRRFDFIGSVQTRIGRLLNGQCVILARTSTGHLEFAPGQFDEKEQAVAIWAYTSGRRAGWSTDTLSESSALYVPLKGQSVVGVLAYKPKVRRQLSADKESLLATVARQLAISIEREIFEDEAAQGQNLRESEKLHQTLLNSISHELRTPLTSILGSASALAERQSGDPYSRDLVLQIVESSERLNRVVENLLDMTRLNGGYLSLKKEWQDIQDLIGVTVRRLGYFTAHRRLRIEIADDLPLIEIDFRLMEHVLSNLLINAFQYSPEASEVCVRASLVADHLRLAIEDEGPGVPAHDLDKIFEKFYRVNGTPAGGTGLGLAICKSIVEAHGGRIYAENRTSEGLRIWIELPLTQAPIEKKE